MLIWVLMLIGGGTLSIWLDLRWFPTLFAHLVYHTVTLVIGVLLLRLV
ncbi:MAG: isoprenylcysteine carboxylmethyltransferase family protein, partial [Chloroflexota bacterium]